MNPSYKTVDGKIKQAIRAVECGKIYLLDQDVIAADLLDLGVEIGGISALLLEILQKISPRHYEGTHPPQKSYKAPILECELYAFVVELKSKGCFVYLKFAIKNNFLWLVSLHENRPAGKEY